MKAGDICPMTVAKVKMDNAEFGFKVPERGDRFIFAFLGLCKKDDESFDVEAAIRSLGWIRPEDIEKESKEICDGCNVREPFEHRCHGSEVCDCPQCNES